MTFHSAKLESSAMYSDVEFSKTNVHGDMPDPVKPVSFPVVSDWPPTVGYPEPSWKMAA